MVEDEKLKKNLLQLKIYSKFMALASSRFRDPTLSSQIDLGHPDYGPERLVITKISNQDIWKSMALGAGTFLFLHRGVRYGLRRFAYRASSSSSKTSNTSSSSSYQPLENSTSSSVARSSPLEQLQKSGTQTTANSNNKSAASWFWSFMRFGLNAFTSLAVAAASMPYLTDRERVMEELSKVPLVEGRSVVSELLCDDFVQLQRDIQRELGPDIWKADPTSSSPRGVQHLAAIRTFCQNCRARRAQESQLRRQMGIADKNQPVLIPHPGVDVNSVVEEEEEGNETDDSQFYSQNSSSDLIDQWSAHADSIDFADKGSGGGNSWKKM